MSIFNEVMPQYPMMPAAYRDIPTEEMERRVWEIKQKHGDALLIPGHHYQRDEVVQFADMTGDSLELARLSAQNTKARHIVFCGVHFMAETCDILTQPHQKVILPDMRAGCSMADMANMAQTEVAWRLLTEQVGDSILPLTYVNSTAEIKAFVGRHGGATVTSSNARQVISWALKQRKRILFLPDQHLGRNTAFQLGIPLDEMAVWDPYAQRLLTDRDAEDIRIILWKGHCSVHEKFTTAQIEETKRLDPEVRVIVHPECTHDVVIAADDAGSTKYIIDRINEAPPGSKWSVGTEMNLVRRLAAQHPEQQIVSLNPDLCPCLTMNRIDLPHLLWSLECIDRGEPTGIIQVPQAIAEDAKSALERMFEHV